MCNGSPEYIFLSLNLKNLVLLLLDGKTMSKRDIHQYQYHWSQQLNITDFHCTPTDLHR